MYIYIQLNFSIFNKRFHNLDELSNTLVFFLKSKKSRWESPYRHFCLISQGRKTKNPVNSCRNVMPLPGLRVTHTRDRKVFNQESRQVLDSPFVHNILILEYQVDPLSRVRICKYVIHSVQRKQVPTKPRRVPRYVIFF